MIEVEQPSAKGSFNQAFYQQERINELILRIDRLNINPLENNITFGLFNYEIILNDLNSLLATVYSKLTPKEREEINQKRIFLAGVFDKYPVYRKKQERVIFYPKIWEAFKSLLFDYRISIELLMDKHELSNPSKADPSRAIVNN